MRLIALLTSLLLSTYVFAEPLNLDGAYGRNGSCGVLKGKYPDTDDWTLLQANELRRHEASCRFVWVAEDEEAQIHSSGAEQVWTVIAQCYIEAEAFSQLLTIQRRGDSITVSGAADNPATDKSENLEKCN